MTETMVKELTQMFTLATLEHAAGQHLDADGWRQYQDITDRFEEKQRALESAYVREYDAAERAGLIDDAGKIRRDFKPGFGVQDRFNPAALEREAHRKVRSAHQATLSDLADLKCHALGRLIASYADPPKALPSGPIQSPANNMASQTRPR